MSQPVQLSLSASPQFFDKPHTARLTWTVFACLVPAALWGVLSYGVNALLVVLFSVLSATIVDALILRRLGRGLPNDGHAALMGLLVAMTMPPAVPLFVPPLAAAFAIAVVKWPLGGTGSAWLHPAAAGWAFAYIAWPQHMGRYLSPGTFTGEHARVSNDAVGAVSNWLASNGGNGLSPSDILNSLGLARSQYDMAVTDFLNNTIFAPFGAYLPGGFVDAMLGTAPGVIGATSALMLMLGSILPLSKKVVGWQAPVGYFASFGILLWTFGGLANGAGLGKGDVLFYVLHGSFLLVLFFMATDISSTPMTGSGRFWFGIGLGLFSVCLVMLGADGQAPIVALLLMQLLTGTIDRLSSPRRLRKGRV